MTKLILALAASTLVATSAHAQSGSWKIGSSSYHIYYADLDTNSAVGRARLLERAERAAGRLCAEPTRGEQRACIAAAVEKVANPRLRQAMLERDAVVLARR